MNENVKKLLKEVAALLPPLLVTAGVFAGFVAVVGGITTWTRFWASQLPPEQAVDVVPRTELVVIGAVTLLFFGVLGLLAVLACYLIDDAGRARRRTLVALLLVGAAEAGLIVLELNRDDYEGRIWESALLVGAAFVVAALIAWKGTRDTHPLPPNAREQAVEERAAELHAAGETDASQQVADTAPRPLRCELKVWGSILLGLVAVGAAVLAVTWLEVPRWAAAGFFLAFLFPLVTYHVAHVTGARFAWYGIALLFSVPLYGAVVTTLRLWGDPQAQPAALIRKGDKKDEGVQGLYITETDKRVYLASVATDGCGGQTVRPHSGRIFWVPRDEIVAMAVGPLQDVAEAALEAPEMVADLAATRVDLTTPAGAPATSTPRSITVFPALREETHVRAVDPPEAPGGTQVTINGDGFGELAGKVFIGGQEASVVEGGWSEESILAEVPATAESGVAAVRVECPSLRATTSLRVQKPPQAAARVTPVRAGTVFRLDGRASRDPDGHVTRHEWKITTGGLAPDDKQTARTANGTVIEREFPLRERPYRVSVDLTVFDDDQLQGSDRVVFIRLPTTVLFCFSCRSLSPGGHRVIRDVGRLIGTTSSVRVDGHTDWVGTQSYNAGLARDRACAVRDALAAASGLSIGRFVARGFGETRPIAPNASPAGRQRNRRVEIVIDVRDPQAGTAPQPTRCSS